MSSLLKKLILILVLVVTAGIVYSLTLGSSDDELSLGLSSLEGSEVSLKTQKILADTQKINGYLQSASLFEDERFTSLQDFRVQIVDTPTGRINPFAPVQ